MTGKRKTEARRWFQQAYYDLKATRWNIEGGFYDTACFLAQQSAEKALKSILYFTGSRRKALMTHSTVEMVREAGKKINTLVELIKRSPRTRPSLYSLTLSKRHPQWISPSVLREKKCRPGSGSR